MKNYKNTPVIETLKKLPRKTVSFIRERPILSAGVILSVLVLLSAASFWPRHVAFSYSQPSCFFHPQILPGLHSQEESQSYSLNPESTVSLGSTPLISTRSCVTALAPPQDEETVRFQPLHLPWPYQSIHVESSAPPAVTTSVSALERVSIMDPLNLELDQPDIISSYTARIDSRDTPCESGGADLSCAIDELELEQARTYEFELQRHINGHEAEPVFSADIETVTPIEIESSSIESGSTVYDAAEEIILTMNKPVASHEGIRLLNTDEDEPHPISIETEEADLFINPEEALPRQASFVLEIEDITATDNGFLSEPYELAFETSGGPQVEGLNVASYGVARSTNPVLTFDYPLNPEQDVSAYVTLASGGEQLPVEYVADGRTLSLVSHQPLPRCSSLTINVSDSLENRHGINGGNAYESSFRTICQRVSTIGSSVEGRPIQAYSFGDDGQTILYVGAIHGSEPSSKYTLQSWIEELEAQYHRIPDNRRIVVIPDANPDGVIAGTRMNSRDVDLNRNFPTANWQSDISTPDGSVEGGGGSSPLSEPEASALADYITAQNPRFVLSYHAVGSFTISNDAGSSRQLSSRYAQMVGYASYTSAETSGVFSYEITGALETWLAENPGIPGMLIELSSYHGNEFWRHQEAMWHATRH